jgi:hypothetical protein
MSSANWKHHWLEERLRSFLSGLVKDFPLSTESVTITGQCLTQGEKNESRSLKFSMRLRPDSSVVSVSVRPPGREKADDEWIEDMKDWLRLEQDRTGKDRAKFHVFESCEKTIDNFESYMWDEHKGAAADGKDVKEKPWALIVTILCALNMESQPNLIRWELTKFTAEATQGGGEGQRV